MSGFGLGNGYPVATNVVDVCVVVVVVVVVVVGTC